jgi:hypothetical protein
MNIVKNLTIILFIVTLFSACSTGKRALERGDYYEATLQSVSYLRSNPESEKAKSTISKSYPLALDYYKQKVDETAISTMQNKYLTIVDIYKKLNNLADEISRCPAALEVVKPVVYFHEQLKKAQDLAVEEQYDAGVQLLKSGNIEDAKKAYDKFEWVNKTSPGFSDVLRKLNEAEFNATIRVVVEKLPYIGDQYQENENRFYDKVFADLIRNSQGKFLKYYKPQEAEKLKIAPLNVVKMQFVDFSVGNIYEKETEKEFVSDTLIIGTSKDGKGVLHNVSGTVKAKVTIHEREIVSRGTLNLKIVDFQTNSMIENRQFPGEYVWRNDWATYNGDERALPENIKKMVKAKQLLPPPTQELFILFSDPLGAKASSFLKSYYQKK